MLCKYHLMLQQTQRALDNHILENGTRRNINRAPLCSNNDDRALERHATSQVDRASNGEVIQLEYLGNRGDVLLEVGNLFEVAAQLDKRGITKTVGAHLQLAMLERVQIRLDQHQVRASLDRQETAAGNIDTMGVFEVADGSTDSSLELDNGNVRLALLVAGNGLAVGNNLHLELVVLDDTLNGLEVQPDVVGVEVLELLDRLELVDVLLGHLGDFQQADGALVVDNGTTLDVGLGLVGQLHNVLGLGLHHVLQNAQVDNGTQVVNIGQENNLNAALNQLVENTRVVQRLENVTVAGRVPLGDGRVEVLGDGEGRVFVDSGVAGLVECEDIDVVAFVLLDDGGGVVVGVERVHENKGDVDVVGAVQVLNLTDG